MRALGSKILIKLNTSLVRLTVDYYWSCFIRLTCSTAESMCYLPLVLKVPAFPFRPILSPIFLRLWLWLTHLKIEHKYSRVRLRQLHLK